jgi:hypothetical protein
VTTCSPRGATVVLDGPVYDILAVLIDGDPFMDWALRDGRKLLRLDGDLWPQTQDLRLADTEVGSFSIEYRIGTPIPTAGIEAVKALACDYTRALLADEDCALPARTRDVVRQGVAVNLLSEAEQEDGAMRLGVPAADRFVYAYNPHGLQERSRAWSPDLPSQHQTERVVLP